VSFFSSIFGGSSPELSALISEFGQIGKYQTGQGQKYTNKAGDFYSDIISGDPTKQMRVMAPAIDAAKKSSSQDIKTATMFGPRSGGTAAKNASSSDTIHGYIADLIGQLTGSAATNLGSLGTTMTSTGLQSLGAETEAVQQQMENWNNSILGLGITKAAGYGLGAALGA
jgi:hypothetical protein